MEGRSLQLVNVYCHDLCCCLSQQPPPQLKPFNMEMFLKGMEGAGPHLTSGVKGNWTGLYQ